MNMSWTSTRALEFQPARYLFLLLCSIESLSLPIRSPLQCTNIVPNQSNLTKKSTLSFCVWFNEKELHVCMYVIYCHWLKTHLQNKNKLRGTVDQVYIQSSLNWVTLTKQISSWFLVCSLSNHQSLKPHAVLVLVPIHTILCMLSWNHSRRPHVARPVFHLHYMHTYVDHEEFCSICLSLLSNDVSQHGIGSILLFDSQQCNCSKTCKFDVQTVRG